MPGCSDSVICKKLKTFPVKNTVNSLLVDTAVNVIAGAAVGGLGSGALGLDRAVGAGMGAAGNGVFGLVRSLGNSVYNHFTKPEEKEEPKKTFRENASNYFSSLIKKKEPEVKEPEEKKEMNYAAIAFQVGKYPCYAVLGSMLGYGLLIMPKEYTIEQVAESSATGVAIIAAACVFIAAVALVSKHCADNFIDATDACMDFICCERDVENPADNTRYRSPGKR